jgi:hypothetical protein
MILSQIASVNVIANTTIKETNILLRVLQEEEEEEQEKN